MVNFFKGIIGGIGNIIPGLSGCALMIILNIYTECINSIYELLHFKNIKKNIMFLFPIGLGVILGTIIFSHIIMFFIDKYPLPTTAAFFGFILGTIPLLFNEANKEGFKKTYIIWFLISFIIGLIITFSGKVNFVQKVDINFLSCVIIGVILSASYIIPGLSGTVILSIMGMYDIYLLAIANVDVSLLIPMSFGLVGGGVIFVFLMKYLLEKYYGATFYFIIGFVVSTLPTVLRGNVSIDFLTFLSFAILILSFILTNYIGKKAKK